MSNWSALVGAALYLALTTGPAGAQTPEANAQRGRQLAERLCTNCHAVGAQLPSVVKPDVPSFAAIARRPEVSAERLAGAIIIPHPAMPGIQLTTAEIRDIVTYILSMKPQK